MFLSRFNDNQRPIVVAGYFGIINETKPDCKMDNNINQHEEFSGTCENVIELDCIQDQFINVDDSCKI